VRFHIREAKASRPGDGFIPNPKLKLLDQVSEVMLFKHYSLLTETTYRDWIKRYIFFHGKRHPREMGAAEVGRFLSHLAVHRNVAASTQNQAFNASRTDFVAPGQPFHPRGHILSSPDTICRLWTHFSRFSDTFCPPRTRFVRQYRVK